MLWLTTKRIFRSGFINFWRNGFVSLSSVLIMVITLFVIGSIIFSNALLTSSLEQIKNKVDINVYFVASANEDEILAVRRSLEALPEVAAVDYFSREQVLADFKKKHENDSLTLQALDELGENPLGALLNVRAMDPSQYEAIAEFFQAKNVLSQEGTPI